MFLSGDTKGTGLLTEQMFVKLVERNDENGQIGDDDKSLTQHNYFEADFMIVTPICLLAFICLVGTRSACPEALLREQEVPFWQEWGN